MNEKTEKCSEKLTRLFKALRLSLSELEKLAEEGPNKEWREDQNDG